MKKIYLILFLLTLAIGIYAQSGTYTANGVTWKYEINGSEASITGEVLGNSYNGALNIPATVNDGINTYNVTSIGDNAFNDYRGATSITLPASLKKIGNSAFNYCDQLKGDLTIPNSVTTIGDRAFSYCMNLDGELTLSTNLTKIGDYAFDDCNKLTGGANMLPDGITEIGEGVFSSCYNITGPLTIPSGVTSIGRQAFWQCSKLTGVLEIPSGLVSIGEGAFWGCSSLTSTSLTIPNGVSKIENFIFCECSGLTGALTLPAGITSIGSNAFRNCSGLTGTLTIPSGVTSIGIEAFEGCSKLTGPLVFPNNITSIGSYAFQGCSGFTGPLTIPDGVTIIQDNTFAGCRGLTGSLTLPSGLTSIGSSAFQLCSGLTGSLVIPSSVTNIGGNAFLGCSGFTGTLTIPNGITTIQGQCFSGCSGFDQLSLPSSVTTLNQFALAGCGFKGTLTIPNTVTFIDSYALADLAKLEVLKFAPGSAITFGQQVFRFGYTLKYIDMTNVTTPITKRISRDGDYLNPSPFSAVLPFTMIYLPTGSNTPDAGEENFVLDGVCDKFVVYDEAYHAVGPYYTASDYPIQHAFNATTATYTSRNIYGETCKTLCLPYPATLPDGMRAYELKEKNLIGRTSFMFTSISGNQLEANKPYLIRIIDGASTKTFGVDNNVHVPITPSTIEVPATSDGTTFFGGTTEIIDNATAAAGGYYNLINNEWRPITTANPNGYVHSFRAYIRSTSPTPAKGFAIVLDDENETTGIGNMEEDIEKGDGKIYSLDGKLLGTDVDALKSGEIYIKNGKKFYKF